MSNAESALAFYNFDFPTLPRVQLSKDSAVLLIKREHLKKHEADSGGQEDLSLEGV